MHSLDLTIVIAYLALITFVGVRLGGRVKSAQDFFLAGRSLTWWVIGLSIIGTNIGTDSLQVTGSLGTSVLNTLTAF